MTPSLLWQVRTVCATCSIHKQHSSIRYSRRDTKVLFKVLFVGGLRGWEFSSLSFMDRLRAVLEATFAGKLTFWLQ